MADLHTATIIADVDLLDTVEFPVRKSATTGLLRGTFAKLKTYLKAGLKMTDFSDVDVTTPQTDTQVLVWNATASKWKPGTVAAGGGGGGSGGGSTVNPTVVQQASAVGSTGAVTLPGAPTAGNLLVAVGTHWTNGVTAAAGWTQLASANGASTDGTIIATKVATADDTATVTPYGAASSACVTVFEVKDWNASTFQPFNYKQETVGTSLTVNFGVPTTGALLVGHAATISANAAPTSITGAGTTGTTVTGTTTNASPRQVTPFYKAGMTKGGQAITSNYAASASQYLAGVVICPDQTGGVANGTSFPVSPSTGDLFYRTDRHMEYFYDGTRWLSKQLFQVAPDLPNSTSYAATISNQHRVVLPKHGHTDVYIEKIALAYILVGVGNWSIAFNANTAAGNTVLGPVAIATAVSGNHYYTETNIAAVSAGLIDLDFTFTKSSGAATLYPMPAIMYRLVG